MFTGDRLNWYFVILFSFSSSKGTVAIPRGIRASYFVSGRVFPVFKAAPRGHILRLLLSLSCLGVVIVLELVPINLGGLETTILGTEPAGT